MDSITKEELLKAIARGIDNETIKITDIEQTLLVPSQGMTKLSILLHSILCKSSHDLGGCSFYEEADSGYMSAWSGTAHRAWLEAARFICKFIGWEPKIVIDDLIYIREHLRVDTLGKLILLMSTDTSIVDAATTITKITNPMLVQNSNKED